MPITKTPPAPRAAKPIEAPRFWTDTEAILGRVLAVKTKDEFADVLGTLAELEPGEQAGYLIVLLFRNLEAQAETHVMLQRVEQRLARNAGLGRQQHDEVAELLEDIRDGLADNAVAEEEDEDAGDEDAGEEEDEEPEEERPRARRPRREAAPSAASSAPAPKAEAPAPPKAEAPAPAAKPRKPAAAPRTRKDKAEQPAGEAAAPSSSSPPAIQATEIIPAAQARRGNVATGEGSSDAR